MSSATIVAIVTVDGKAEVLAKLATEVVGREGACLALHELYDFGFQLRVMFLQAPTHAGLFLRNSGPDRLVVVR